MNQQQQQRIQALEAERGEHHSKRERLRSQLDAASERFKRSRSYLDGEEVTKLTAAHHLEALAIEGIDEELERMRQPQRVQVTASRKDLLEQRRQVVQRRDFRHKQHQEQVEQERARCPFRDEKHVQAHLRNTFGPSEIMRRRTDEQDQRVIDHIDAQFAELDRRAQHAGASAS